MSLPHCAGSKHVDLARGYEIPRWFDRLVKFTARFGLGETARNRRSAPFLTNSMLKAIQLVLSIGLASPVKNQTLRQDQLRQVRRLRFDPKLEAAFAEQHTAATIGRVRVVFTVLALFGLLGLVGRRQSSDLALFWVDTVFTLFFFVLLGMAFLHRLRHFATPALAVAAVLSQVVVALTTKTPQPGPGIVINLLYMIIIVGSLQARFFIALAFCAAMVWARAWTFSYRGMWSDDTVFLFVLMVTEGVFLCLASYLNEVRDRKGFLLEESLIEEKERSSQLVRNVLPPTIADRLSKTPGVLAEQHDSATILFCDLMGFTSFAASAPPEKVVGLLNDLFSRFDALLPRFEVLKVKTIGDCYMVAGGIPEECADHTSHVADLALELRGTANAMGVDVRIGVHTGPVIAGVLGTERLMYDVWGPTVNTASRLESSAPAGTIAVSSEVRSILIKTHDFDGPFVEEFKGMGATQVWHLVRRKVRGLVLG